MISVVHRRVAWQREHLAHMTFLNEVEKEGFFAEMAKWYPAK